MDTPIQPQLQRYQRLENDKNNIETQTQISNELKEKITYSIEEQQNTINKNITSQDKIENITYKYNTIYENINQRVSNIEYNKKIYYKLQKSFNKYFLNEKEIYICKNLEKNIDSIPIISARIIYISNMLQDYNTSKAFEEISSLYTIFYSKLVQYICNTIENTNIGTFIRLCIILPYLVSFPNITTAAIIDTQNLIYKHLYIYIDNNNINIKHIHTWLDVQSNTLLKPINCNCADTYTQDIVAILNLLLVPQDINNSIEKNIFQIFTTISSSLLNRYCTSLRKFLLPWIHNVRFGYVVGR